MSVAKAAAIKERFAKEIAEAAEKALVMLITGGHGEEVVEGARSCVDIEIVENRLAIRAVVTKIKNEKLTAKLFFDISHAEHEVTVKSVPFLSEV
jgi:hypothetical protein